MSVSCSSCGNDRKFLVKTLQMHVVRVEDSRVEIDEESRPAIFEFLCDECETALSVDEFEEPLRREIVATLGSR